VTLPRGRPRRQRGARYTGAEPAGHRGRASGNKPQLPVRHGQNDRPIAVGRNNWTFAGSDAGGQRAAAIYTLIETAKLDDVDPQAWLTDVLV
jgi:IS66 C-terminal element